MSQKPNALDMFKNIKPVEKKQTRGTKKVEKQEKAPATDVKPVVHKPETKEIKEDEDVSVKINENKVSDNESIKKESTTQNITPSKESLPEPVTERKLNIYRVEEGTPTKLVSVRMLDEEFMKLKLYSLKNGIPKYEIVHSIIQSEKAYDEWTGFPTDEFIVQHAMDTVKHKVTRKQKCAFRLTTDDIDFVNEMSANCAMTKQEYYIFLLNEYIK